MRRLKSILVIGLLAIVVICIFLFISLSDFKGSDKQEVQAVPDSILFSSAPVLSPEEALLTFQIEDGFRIELIASEPLIHDPVAMDFDARGRLWVVEMQSYMPDVEGNGEETPSGRIVILEDLDGDARMDTAKVFLDNLVLPRAISVVNGGVLFSEPPNLFFVENLNDRPGKKTLVDSAYAVGGNVEHQPNGLMRGIDNWHYNAKSSARYKLEDGQWVKEETEFRGQWGITKDDYGRLFYNTNSNQLRGDLLPPSMLIRNPDLITSEGINREIVEDQRVYPIRPTPGINRGYQDHMLDEQLRLRTFTAASSAVIYRGDQFPEAYQGNAFVCEPAGNLVKRNILVKEGPYIEGRQAYQGKEFLASKDERFRPVSIYNGPDGSLYLVDMYRGIIQHETYLTEYLRDQILSRGLQTPLGLGRIYRIVYEGNWFHQLMNKWKDTPQPALHTLPDNELVAFLSHPNGWWRDEAQRLLVEHNKREVVPLLTNLLKGENSLAKIHALWTLEGMGIHDPSTINLAFKDKDPEVVATAIRVAERNAKNNNAAPTLAEYEALLEREDPQIQLQLALSLGEFKGQLSGKAMELLKRIAISSPEDTLMMEAILSSVYEKEKELYSYISEAKPGKRRLLAFLNEHIETAVVKASLKEKDLTEKEKEVFILGKTLFDKTCAACHGQHGKGVKPIAPPLDGSHWVTGPVERLILITLHGMEGPVTVNGKLYKTPEVQPVMPGLKHNPEFTDEKLAAVLTYIRNAWSNEAEAVRPEQVKEVRVKTEERKEPFTEEELMK